MVFILWIFQNFNFLSGLSFPMLTFPAGRCVFLLCFLPYEMSCMWAAWAVFSPAASIEHGASWKQSLEMILVSHAAALALYLRVRLTQNICRKEWSPRRWNRGWRSERDGDKDSVEGARGMDTSQSCKRKTVKSEPGLKHFFQTLLLLLFSSKNFDRINISVQRKKTALVLYIGSRFKSLLCIWKFIVLICTVFTYPFIYDMKPLLLLH